MKKKTCSLTTLCNEYENDVVLLSCENGISGELGLLNLSVPNRVDPKLRSELVETQEVRPASM